MNYRKMTKTERETDNLTAAIGNILNWPETDPCKADALADYESVLTDLIGDEAAEKAIAFIMTGHELEKARKTLSRDTVADRAEYARIEAEHLSALAQA